jgi:hypothetical protein
MITASQLPKPPEMALHGTKVTDESIPKVTIWCTDYLQEDPKAFHPVVIVHFVDITTGQYLMKSNSTQPGAHFSEAEAHIESSKQMQVSCEYILPMMTHPCPLGISRT